ncbi:MAG: hypothetical protein H6Q20_1350 [Bacteroidetes bacterium]|nr:hypothetical protein [Bacteroidota bacterium]
MTENIPESKKSLLKRILKSIRNIADIHNDTHIEATIESIKKDIEFRGSNVWILFFAIIVASVGLNVNSTAVIIGAMLISPLMGPINGVGLAVGTFDNELLRNSLRNLFTMVAISLLASTTYFFISPLSDAQSELLARTTPTIFDVFIALFGGMAGIVAASRRESKITIISGVAIATALMPPLCTAGYGLASGQMSYFFGAFYLFFINSFFIALATFLMVRYLHFPVKQFVNPNRERVVKRSITIFAIIAILPSIYMAWSLVNETRFNSQATKYLHEIQELEMFNNIEVINTQRTYSSKQSAIALSLIGGKLTDEQLERLKGKLSDYGLAGTNLIVKQTGGSIDMGTQEMFISKLLDKQDQQLKEKDTLIARMSYKLEKYAGMNDEMIKVARELKIQYPDIEKFSFSSSVFTNPTTLQQDTFPVFYVEWKKSSSSYDRNLNEWLKVRLNAPQLQIIEVK